MITKWAEKWARRLGIPHAVAGSLVLALFLASASFLLERFTPTLEWLDVAMLYVTPSIFTHEPSPDVASEILVVTIGAEVFETRFGGQTPIARASFAKLLSEVVGTFKPEVLALDYDLSPGCGDFAEDATIAARTGPADSRLECGPVTRDVAGRAALDRYLGSSPAKRLVLIRLPVEDFAHCRARHEWETGMRDRGMVFGKPDLVHHGLLNAVVKYEDRPESFAGRVHCGTVAPGTNAPTCRKPESVTPATASKEAGPCGPREAPKRPKRADLHLFNFPKAVKGVRTCHLDRPTAIKDCVTYYGDRGFRSVFVGAAYEQSDVFETPIGPKPGVTLHAYAAYSMKHPLKPKHELAFFIDVVIGTLAGLLFHKTWGQYATYRPAERLARALLSFGGLVVACAALVLLSPWPMAYGWWINPGPMLLGLFVKSWHTSIGHVAHRPRFPDRVVGLAYSVLWIGVVGAAVIVIVGGPLFGSH